MLAPAPQLSNILRKVKQVELRALKALDSNQIGQFRSVFRGQGMEFDQVREYVPGDDVRHIDWNATARAGRPFVKVHIEERDLCVVLAMDVSPSSDFGTVGSTKREQMAEIAAVLAFATLRGNDRVGLVLFTDEVELSIPPRKGRAQVLQIVRAVLSHEPRGTSTALQPALEHLRSLTTRRAAVFLLSDFFTTEQPEQLAHALRVASLQHEVVALRCTDPLEEALPDVGVVVFEDAETGEIVELDTSNSQTRARYEALAAERSRQLADQLRGAGVDLLQVHTDRDYTPQLAAFFKNRRRTNR